MTRCAICHATHENTTVCDDCAERIAQDIDRDPEAAARGLALALASGDDAAAARAALWFVDESAAMDAALARLAGEVRS